MSKMNPEIIDSYLIILVSYQLLIFAIILYFSGISRSYSKKILAFFFIAGWFVYFALGSFFLGWLEVSTWIYYLFVPALLSVCPLFYIYVKSLTSEKFIFTLKCWLHLYPAAISLVINLLLFGILSPAQREWFLTNGFVQKSNEPLLTINIYFYYLWDFLIFPVQLILYFVLIYKEIKNHHHKIREIFSNLENKKLNWLYWAAVIFVVLILFNNLLIQSDLIDHAGIRIFYNVGMLLFTLFIFFSGLKQITIYDYAMPGNREDGKSLEELAEKQRNRDKAKNTILQRSAFREKNRIVNLSETEQKNILQKTETAILSNKLFLNPELKITDLSIEVSIPRRHISQAINEQLKMNFYNFINRYRIQEAIKLMNSESSGKFSIEGIARQSGFNSRSSFYTAFKTETGLTPSSFLKDLKKAEKLL